MDGITSYTELLNFHFRDFPHNFAVIVGPYMEIWANTESTLLMPRQHIPQEVGVRMYSAFKHCREHKLNFIKKYSNNEQQELASGFLELDAFECKWTTVALDQHSWYLQDEGKRGLVICRVYNDEQPLNFAALVIAIANADDDKVRVSAKCEAIKAALTV